MPSEAERQDSDVTPPTAGTTPGLNVTSLATSTSSAVFDLDAYAELYGRYIDVTADGGTIYVAFAAASGTIDESVAGASLVAGTLATVPWPIRDGEVRAFRLSRRLHRYLHVKAATGTPKLRICGSSPRGRDV